MAKLILFVGLVLGMQAQASSYCSADCTYRCRQVIASSGLTSGSHTQYLQAYKDFVAYCSSISGRVTVGRDNYIVCYEDTTATISVTGSGDNTYFATQELRKSCTSDNLKNMCNADFYGASVGKISCY